MSAYAAFLWGLALGAFLGAGLTGLIYSLRNRRLGRLFSHAAHEINTPITAINITVLNLLNGIFGDISADQVKWVEMMREQTNRLCGMVGELRDLIHMQLSRDLLLRAESVAVTEIVDAAAAAVRRGMAQARCDVKTRLDGDLPRVRVDQDRIVRTLVSLIFHARKFRAHEGLLITAARQEEYVALRLEYQGHTQNREDPRSSMDLFYPARSRQGNTLNSVGLGLGMLRAVARQQGGELTFTVEPGGRSVLSLLLPISWRD